MRRHVVVDGSNIATEGRTMPSLRQLNDAVLAFMEEFPDDIITVVVDATFAHRIDAKEVADFDAAVENNEIVSPPAGAVGRGDAFVLTIANKVDATILSNDSYQEFHGDYAWLFDDGRLLGGKPVPNVGWVFVPRSPVRGPLSRRAMRDAKKSVTRGRTPRPSKLASEPLPVPKTPPPGPKTSPPARVREPAATLRAPAVEAPAKAVAATPAKAVAATPAKAPGVPAPKHVPANDVLVFLDFVEKHPVGSVVTGVIESFSSHGAYAMVGPARCYIPLRLMGKPPPRSARDVVKLGDERPLVVVSFNAARRGIDAALEGFEPADVARVPAAPKGRPRRKAVEAAPAPVVEAPAEKAGRRLPARKERPAPAPAEEAAPVKAARKRARPGAAEKAPAGKAAVTAKAPAEEVHAAEKAPEKVRAARVPTEKAAARKAGAGKAAARKAPARKAAEAPAEGVAPPAARPKKAAKTTEKAAAKEPTKAAAKAPATRATKAAKTAAGAPAPRPARAKKAAPPG